MENNVNQEAFEPQNENNKNKIIITMIVVLVIFLIGGLAFIGYNVWFKDNDNINDTDDDSNQIDDNDINEDNNHEEEKYTLDVYKNENGSYCENKSDYCNTLAFTIDVESKDAKYLANMDERFILYVDNGIILYDTKENKKRTIDIGNNIESCELVGNSDNINGIIVSSKIGDNYKYKYYNLEKNKYFYEGQYSFIRSINDKYLVGFDENGKAYVISALEEKIATEYIEGLEECVGCYYNLEMNAGSKKFYFLTLNSFDCGNVYVAVYDTNKKFIATGLDEESYDVVDNYLYVNQENIIKKYDVDGNLLNTLEELKNTEILTIIRNYAFYVENHELKIINIDTKDNKKIADWKDTNYIDYHITGYYDRKTLDDMNQKNKKVGIYIAVYYQGDSKDENGNYGMEYCYTDNDEIEEYPIKTMMGGYSKPILYLYPTRNEKITVEFAHPELLLTTYPKYKGKWEVTASPNGDLRDKDNKYYYALYWDEVRHSEVDFKEGFYVTSDNAINFLEEKLTLIGLNDRERNEFIMYWLPILENNKQSLVYFELTKERELNNKLIINPKPDSLLRIAIHIKKVDKKINIKEQKLETFKRYGFSAIEWGGMVY